VRAAHSAAPTNMAAASNAANNLVPSCPPDDVEDAPTEPMLVQTGTGTAVKLRIDPC
jgi:hypothetical protein